MIVWILYVNYGLIMKMYDYKNCYWIMIILCFIFFIECYISLFLVNIKFIFFYIISIFIFFFNVNLFEYKKFFLLLLDEEF